MYYIRIIFNIGQMCMVYNSSITDVEIAANI